MAIETLSAGLQVMSQSNSIGGLSQPEIMDDYRSKITPVPHPQTHYFFSNHFL